MNWHNIKITLKKELRGIVRDRKSLLILITSPLMIPALLLIMGLFYNTMSEKAYKVGVDYSPNINEMQIAEEMKNIDIREYANLEELQKGYEQGSIDAYITRDEKKYTVYYDSSSNTGEMAGRYAEAYLNAYNQFLGNNYLISEDIDTDLVYKNIEISMEKLSREGEDPVINMLFSMLLPYVLMIVSMGTTTIGTDATAGEKERGTLETLLTFPIKSSEIISGKYLATAIVGILSGLFALVLALTSMAFIPKIFTVFSDVETNFTFLSVILAIFIIFISSMLYAGLSIAIAGTTKTFKEAQTALQPLSFFSMAPMFLSMFEIDGWVISLIPLVNCGTMLNDIFFDKTNALDLILMFASTLIYTVLIIIFISKQYKSEKTLFS